MCAKLWKLESVCDPELYRGIVVQEYRRAPEEASLPAGGGMHADGSWCVVTAFGASGSSSCRGSLLNLPPYMEQIPSSVLVEMTFSVGFRTQVR